MNLVKNIDQYDENNVFFCDPIKNNIMTDGHFIRIFYSTSLFVANGIHLFVPLSDISVEKYYNKFKCCFNPNNHKTIIEGIKVIEAGLLKNINIDKIPQFKIYDQLKNGSIKIFSENLEKTNMFMLKISGIWETDTYYGVTYKFIKIKAI